MIITMCERPGLAVGCDGFTYCGVGKNEKPAGQGGLSGEKGKSAAEIFVIPAAYLLRARSGVLIRRMYTGIVVAPGIDAGGVCRGFLQTFPFASVVTIAITGHRSDVSSNAVSSDNNEHEKTP